MGAGSDGRVTRSYEKSIASFDSGEKTGKFFDPQRAAAASEAFATGAASTGGDGSDWLVAIEKSVMSLVAGDKSGAFSISLLPAPESEAYALEATSDGRGDGEKFSVISGAGETWVTWWGLMKAAGVDGSTTGTVLLIHGR